MAYPAYAYPNFQQQYNQPSIPNMPMNYYPMQQQQIPVSQQQFNLNGKIVENIDNVKLTDVPMDGNNYYFPKADGTEIYTKRWLANGTTEIAVYAKVVDTDVEPEIKFDFDNMQNSIMDKLNSIEEHVAKFEKGLNRTQTKKEA